ncbi:MAG: ribonuclease E/G, partial [Rhodocyclaceae bacterium]|nr:ribonuclease E/G [Rhodocyclaceae bacterium]
MSEEFLINFTPQETRVALMQQGAVQELHVERIGGRGIVGNIYLGRVVRVLPGMQSAFIEVGLERTAFLHVADIWNGKNGERLGAGPHPIERLIVAGETLMVQVLKDPIGTKGARLTTQISLAGRLLVYLPQEKHIGISQKIDDGTGTGAGRREQLRERIAKLLPADETGGFIVRTMAENASDAELAADIAYLRRLWQEIRHLGSCAAAPKSAAGGTAPALLHHDLT